jgi:hypothetical protein
MTKFNDTEIKVYDQLIKVQKCIDALKDVYLNIPEEDRYSCVLSVVGDKLQDEFNCLMPLVLGNIKEDLKVVS